MMRTHTDYIHNLICEFEKSLMAARTGFEPVNAALRGLWLQPLAERAMYLFTLAHPKFKS